MSNTAGFDPKRRLGRGLSALLGGSAPAAEETMTEDTAELRNLSVQELARNPFQPRREFDAESLGELASSIKEHGVLQPLLVREVDGGQVYAVFNTAGTLEGKHGLPPGMAERLAPAEGVIRDAVGAR